MPEGPVIAPIVSDIRGEGGEQAGAVELRRMAAEPERVAGIAFRCPCGCGEESYLPVTYPDQSPARTSWDFDGNETAPTVSPSVLQSGLPCKWHGFLRNGEWVTA